MGIFSEKKIAIVFKPQISEAQKVLEALEKILAAQKISYESFSIDCPKHGFDFVFVIGGDGTLLRAARFFAKEKTPVFGFNLGKLGFLAQSKVSELEQTVKKIINLEFKTEDRLMLVSNNDILALNEFVIRGTSATKTSRFCLSINEKFVCEYLADGLIISTPTGSTAYGLSAGGAILHPEIEAISVVPICPHTLTARPLIVPANEMIKVSTCDINPNLTLISDGQGTFENITEIKIQKCNFKAKLAFLEENDFYSVLREKLQWGVAPKSN